MADGMAWSTGAFDRQGGVLEDESQLALYCRNVIGYPALFTLDQVSDRGSSRSRPGRTRCWSAR